MLEVTDKTFEHLVEQEKKPVLLDFFGPDCPPCRILAPILDEMAAALPSVVFGKVDVFANSELQDRFGVMSIPTFILFIKGQEADRRIGAKTRSELLAWIKELAGEPK
jgi:thioredoxin 1